MTKSQTELMKRCIAAVRDAQQCQFNLTTQGGREHDFELIEVGWINGVNPRTAASLVAMGLLVEDMPTWSNEFTATHVRLPRYGEMPGFHGNKQGKPLVEIL